MEFDRDLQSIQEVRDLIGKSKAAQEVYQNYTQEQVDQICKHIADACVENAERLAKMAVEETGFGIWQDKVLKNLLGSVMTYNYFKNMKTIGILSDDPKTKIMEVAVPMGVVAALIPSTNPTSTVMYKSLICLKSGNGIVISPHPNAKKCTIEAARIVQKAAKEAGAPDGLVQVITIPSMEGTNALITDKRIGIILATGGEAMVRSAYKSGNPALGVGPGNGPSFIEKSADIPLAVKRIFDSKTFDNGTICASEQSIIVEECSKDAVLAEVKKQGGYLLSPEETKKVGAFILRANGTMNPKIVGKSALVIADMAGISVPPSTRVLVSMQTTVGKDNPYSREKLCPILGFYVEKDWESACKRSIEILFNEGAGHTMTIHSNNPEVIKQFALKKPVSRLIVNTPGSLGGTGATTALPPAFTLGCGAVGGSATSDNINPMNLINIRRVAYGLKELSDLRAEAQQIMGGRIDFRSASGKPNYTQPSSISFKPSSTGSTGSALSASEVEAITKAVLARLS